MAPVLQEAIETAATLKYKETMDPENKSKYIAEFILLARSWSEAYMEQYENRVYVFLERYAQAPDELAMMEMSIDHEKDLGEFEAEYDKFNDALFLASGVGQISPYNKLKYRAEYRQEQLTKTNDANRVDNYAQSLPQQDF